MNWLRFLIAITWTGAWGAWRWATAWPRNPWRRRMAWMWGRHESPTPVWCDQCGWLGPRRWTKHTYWPDGCGDVEPVDECPACGAEV
jgi:hypothetical protein